MPDGDISRSSFRPEAHFSSVRMQQGRVQLDADWNEQVDITSRWNRAATTDIVGRHKCRPYISKCHNSQTHPFSRANSTA